MKLDTRVLLSFMLGAEAFAGCATSQAPAQAGAATAASYAAPGPDSQSKDQVATAATPLNLQTKEGSHAAPCEPDAGVTDTRDGSVGSTADAGAPRARRNHPADSSHSRPISPDYCPPCGMG